MLPEHGGEVRGLNTKGNEGPFAGSIFLFWWWLHNCIYLSNSFNYTLKILLGVNYKPIKVIFRNF